MNPEVTYHVDEQWDFNDSVKITATVGQLVVFEFYIEKGEWDELKSQVDLWFDVGDAR